MAGLVPAIHALVRSVTLKTLMPAKGGRSDAVPRTAMCGRDSSEPDLPHHRDIDGAEAAPRGLDVEAHGLAFVEQRDFRRQVSAVHEHVAETSG
jgi:hypothetical protein